MLRKHHDSKNFLRILSLGVTLCTRNLYGYGLRFPKIKKQPGIYAVKCSEECKDCISGKPNNSSVSAGHNTEGKTPLDKTQQSTPSYNKSNTLFDTMMYTSWTEKMFCEVLKGPSVLKRDDPHPHVRKGTEISLVLSLQCCVKDRDSAL